MASGTLIIAMIFFAARGYFLGLAGVFARVLGLLCGYFVGFSYRSDLANIIAARSDSGAHPIVLQMISGALLFFGTMFLVSFAVIGLFRLLAKLLPFFRAILTKEAMASRVAGATLNAVIAAMLVLSGLYIYGLTLGKNQPPDDLQRLANRFGLTMVNLAQSIIAEEDRPTKDSITEGSMSLISSALDSAGNLNRADSSTTPQSTNKRAKGTAEIISMEDPQHRVLIEKVREVFNDQSGDQELDLQSLLHDEDLKDLANNPQLRDQAMEYLQSNPEKMLEVLNNPKFRELLEQWESQ